MLTKDEADRAADVFTTHYRFVEAVARRHAPGPDHVQDIVQSVGIQICRGLPGFREEADIKTWLYRVTVNTSHDYYRSQQRQQGRTVEAMRATPTPDQVVDPDDVITAGERCAALYDAVQRLKPKYRERIVHDLTEPAVLPDRRVSRRWARKQLRRLLVDDPRLDD